MSADHGLSERVYSALKHDIVEGHFPNGRVWIAPLVDRYQSSATPIREAMLRLVGEGLLVMPGRGGFEIPTLDETAVRHLYTLSLCTMLDAVNCPSGEPVASIPSDESAFDGVSSIEELFQTLVKQKGNPFFLSRIRGLDDQMRRIRRAEQRSLEGLEREFSALVAQIQRNDRSALRRSVVAYHRRRVRHLPEIMAALHREQFESF